jgi:hypothetical protein
LLELIGNDIYLEIPTDVPSLLKSILELCWKPPLVRATISDLFEELGVYIVQEENNLKKEITLQIVPFESMHISNEARLGQGNYSTVYTLSQKQVGKKNETNW